MIYQQARGKGEEARMITEDQSAVVSLLEAPSKGRYYHERISGKFPEHQTTRA